MNKKLLVTFCFLISAFLSHAQSYDWVTGGGSTDALAPSAGPFVHANNICTDDNGNVYVTSVVGGTGITADTFYEAMANNNSAVPHILFASYRCDGTMRWAKLLECTDESLVGNGAGNNGLVYSNGSVYMVGAMYGYDAKYFGYDTAIYNTYYESFMVRFDTLGQLKWIRFVGPDSASTTLRTGDAGLIAIDGQGYIHDFNFIYPGVTLTSSFTTDTNGTYDLKYDSTGNLVSAARVQLDSIWQMVKGVFNKQDNKFYVVLTPNESYYFTYYSTLNSAVCAFRPDESMIWMDTTGQGGTAISMDYKGGNEIYVCGSGSDTFSLGGITAWNAIFPTYFAFGTVFKLDTNGIAHWVYNLQSNEGVDRFSDVSILPGEKIAATGAFYGTGIHGTDTLRVASPEPLFLIVDSSGRTVTLNTFIATGGLDAAGNIITSDAVGNVYVGGTLDNTMSATGLTPFNSIGGATDFFVLKYGYDCSCLAAPIAGFTVTGIPNVSFTYTGTTAGIDSIVWSYGDGHSGTGTTSSHTYANGTYTACATVYTGCGSDEYCKTITIGHEGVAPSGSPQGGVTVFPNPVSEQLMIENAAIGTTVSLFNIMGQQVYYGTIVNSLQALDMQNLPPGNYIVQLTDVSGNRMNKTVVKD